MRAVVVEDLRVSIGDKVILDNISLHVEEGEIVLITGRCGSGKTTLLKVLSGVIPSIYTEFKVVGRVEVVGLNPRKAVLKGFIAYIPQDIYTFLIGCDACEELEVVGIQSRGFEYLCRRPIETLSDGELYRLLIYIALHGDAKVVLVDEPSAHLDREIFLDILDKLRRLAEERGIAVVIADHRVNYFQSYVDKVVNIGCEQCSEDIYHRVMYRGSRGSVDSSRYLVYVNYLKTVFRDRMLFDNLSLQVYEGEVFGVIGRNGVGKTTLLKILAGIIPYSYGEVFVEKPVFYIPQRPIYWFSSGSVRDEINKYIEVFRRGLDVDDVLELFYLEKVADRNPYTLSVGEARKLSMALAYIARPRVLLFDEPLLGLDRDSEEVFIELLESIRKHRGAVVMASHSRDLTKYTDRYIEIR
jgi:energy-coupling factor transport system ATP-binding protein